MPSSTATARSTGAVRARTPLRPLRSGAVARRVRLGDLVTLNPKNDKPSSQSPFCLWPLRQIGVGEVGRDTEPL